MTSIEDLFEELISAKARFDAAKEEEHSISEKHFASGNFVPGNPIIFGRVIDPKAEDEWIKAWDNLMKTQEEYYDARTKYLDAVSS